MEHRFDIDSRGQVQFLATPERVMFSKGQTNTAYVPDSNMYQTIQARCGLQISMINAQYTAPLLSNRV